MINDSTKSASAYLLVTHGSRNPYYQIAVEKVAQMVRQQLKLKYVSDGEQKNGHGSAVAASKIPRHLVGTSSLELASEPLHKSIEDFAYRAKAIGYQQVIILPLFLLNGVHVQEDIPTQVKLAKQTLDNSIQLRLLPYLGTHPDLPRVLAQKFPSLLSSGKILLSHGSRLSHANQSMEKLASQLGAVAAFWSTKPSLEEQVELLVAMGNQEIVILPFFLFSGGITEAIASQVQEIQAKFPDQKIILGQSLGVSEELGAIIASALVSDSTLVSLDKQK